MCGMIGNTKLQTDHRRNAGAGPQVAPKAVGRRTTTQQLGQTRQLFGRQSPRGAWWRATLQGLGASLTGTRHPLADRPFADAEGFGDLALRPALLFELPSLEASGFFPGRSSTVHASEYSTNPPGL
jgi:hypothetical protein